MQYLKAIQTIKVVMKNNSKKLKKVLGYLINRFFKSWCFEVCCHENCC